MAEQKPRFTHTFSIDFSIDTDHEADEVDAEELMRGLMARITGIMTENSFWQGAMDKATGMPIATHTNEQRN